MSKKHFLRGLRDGIPIGLGYFAVSFGIGISAHNAHLSIFQGFLLSFLNNASSGEYGGITIIAADSGVVALGVQQARTVALFYCLLAFSHSIAAVCRGAGRAVVPMMIMLSVWCVIRIIYIMLVVRFIGEIGYIYWAYPLTWAISSTIYLIYYLRSDWVHGFER